VTPPAASQPATQGPAIADDVDVIEKEWVDEAQKVIDATKNDPYTEEEAIEQLQVDYMQKRFGMDVQASHESPPTPPAAEEPDKS
jgi:hypothetical protein